MLHLLSSKLTKSQVKNESLKVEKASLVDELALARDTIERDIVVAVNNDDVEEQSTSLYGRFSLRGVGNNNSNNSGSIRLLSLTQQLGILYNFSRAMILPRPI